MLTYTNFGDPAVSNSWMTLQQMGLECTADSYRCCGGRLLVSTSLSLHARAGTEERVTSSFPVSFPGQRVLQDLDCYQNPFSPAAKSWRL